MLFLLILLLYLSSTLKLANTLKNEKMKAKTTEKDISSEIASFRKLSKMLDIFQLLSVLRRN